MKKQSLLSLCIVVVITVALMLTGCESSDGDSTGATISGTVIDRGGAQLLAGSLQGVVVSLEGTGLSATTSETGEYVIFNVPAGAYTLVFEGAGLSGSVAITVPDGAVVKVEVEGVYLDDDGFDTGEVEIEIEIEHEDEHEDEDESEDDSEDENEVEDESEDESDDDSSVS
ncbi:hypothetical protein BVX97_02445 [bacterium E08(2017)]|nr:hypothetical protein BVX97_02445 [bacterium E08(2017)]